MARTHLVIALFLAALPQLFAGSYDDVAAIFNAPQPLPADTLIRASYLVSGVAPDRIDAEAEDLQKYLRQIQHAVASSAGTEYMLGQSLLTYLHATRLKRYDSSESSMRTLFEKGKFNCVSSALLYLICARSFGLTIEPIRTTRHVFCRVKTGGVWVDVETTSKFGFDPGTKEEFFDEFGRITGFRYVPPKNYRYRQTISDLQLLSLIVQGRLESNDPSTLRFALEWYGYADAEGVHKELAYAWSRYVQWLNKKQHYDDAVTFVKYYVTRFGTTPTLQRSVQTLVSNQVVILAEKQRLEAGEQLLDEAMRALPLRTTRILAEHLVAAAMKNAQRTKNFDEPLELTARLLAKGYLEEPVSQRYSQYFQSKKLYESARKK